MTLTPVQLDKLTRALLVATGIALAVGLLVLIAGSGATGLGEVVQASRWYIHHQWVHNPLVLPVALFTLLFGGGLIAAMVWSRANYRRDLLSGGVPAREVEAVSAERLVREARQVIEPLLTAPKPRVSRVVDGLLGLPVDFGASELSLEPGPVVVNISLGMAMERVALGEMPRPMYDLVLDQLRAMAGIEEETGDGQLELHSSDSDELLRVVIRPGIEGPRIRLQVLSRLGFALTLEELGMPAEVLRDLVEALDQRGVVLINAPPGQGVTTTLYAAAHYVDHRRERPGLIASLEAPVRHELPFVHQTELGAAAPAAVLRSVARRGYPVILVRHLDDREALKAAFELAPERLLLGSLSAPASLEAVRRAAALLGADPVAATLLISIGQRLLRRICPSCRVATEPTAQERLQLRNVGGIDDLAGTFYRGRGCESCSNTGYAGKIAVYETTIGGPELRELLGLPDLEGRARAAVLNAALEAARKGNTTVGQVIRTAMALRAEL